MMAESHEGGLSVVDYNTFTFSAGEQQVRIGPLADAKEINIVARVGSSQELVSLVLALEALNSSPGFTGKVHLSMPYLPYSRQDRRCAEGEAFSLKVLATMLKPYLRFEDTLVTWDVHSPVAASLFSYTNFSNVQVDTLLRSFEISGVEFSKETVVIAPDKGAVERATLAAKTIGSNTVLYATKVRDPDTGFISETQIPDFDYSNKKILIVDDICDGGRTFIELAKVLRTKGPQSVDLYITHGIFSKGFDVFENLIDTFYVANLLDNKFFYEHTPANLITLKT